jgi:hypothetical protein
MVSKKNESGGREETSPGTGLAVAGPTADPEAGFESVARFQSLQAGQYWRAQIDIFEEGIDAGTVLLIQSIRWVDDAQHTVVLRPHPSKIGQRVELVVPQEGGKARKKYFHYDEHRFLLNDFLASFEFEPDHHRIRSDEVRAVQDRINTLQTELLETQSKPALLAKVVEAGLREEAGGKTGTGGGAGASDGQATGPGAGVPTLPGSAIMSLATGTVADAIGSKITSESVAAMKAAASREHQIATIKANWIQGKTTAIAETIREMTPYYEEQAAAALAQTEDVRSYVTKLLEGIESLDLYVGKNVEVQTVREGIDAPKDVPLTFVQRKLLMDEELAVWTDIDEWFDFEEEDHFFDALRKRDGLVAQIFPTERCVLVMATTRRHIDYGDSWANHARNDENRKVFLLVRNGMNIHRVFSPVESHLGSDRLFPTKDDQERIFKGFDGSQIKFEDVSYTDKLATHERFALHYKRFLLLMCGLDHRLKLFGDFYDGPQSLHFVSMAFQERYCHFLHDDDSSLMLAGQEQQTVESWIEEKNTYLRSGSRVLCNWAEVMNPDTAPGACRATRDRNYGRGFERRYDPKEKFSVCIPYKEGDSFCVDVDVSGYSYSSHSDREFRCKVNLSKLKDNRWDHTDLPFLCLDSVEPADLRHYIHHRGSRVNHLAYIRFFKQALKYIEAERAEEGETRERLALALAEGNIAVPIDRPAIIGQAVVAWRAANRGRALPKFDGGDSSSAWKSLLDQMYMLAGEGKRRVSEIESFVRDLGLEPLRLVLSGGAKLVVYAAPKAEECDDRLEPHAWVHRIGVERGKTKYVEKTRRWVQAPEQAASETTMHEWGGVEAWSKRVSVFASFEHKRRIMDHAQMFGELLGPFLKTMSDLEHEGQVEDWKRVRRTILERSKYVKNPMMVVPFGVAIFERSQRAEFLCVGSARAHALLARLAPNEQAIQGVRAAYVKPFAKKEHAITEFDHALSADSQKDWGLFQVSLAWTDNRVGVFAHEGIGIEVDRLPGEKHSPLLADWFDNWRREYKDRTRVWLADGAVDKVGRLTMDALLGISLPPDYEPVRVREFKLSSDKGAVPKYHRWLDLCPGVEEAGSFWGSSRDKEFETLVNSVTGGDKRFGCGSSSAVYLSRAAARSSIPDWVKDDTLRAVSSVDLADAPAPPTGIERWYVLDAQ